MRIVTYMKDGKVLTKELPDLTESDKAKSEALKALAAQRKAQREK